jgi:hypothetical protein
LRLWQVEQPTSRHPARHGAAATVQIAQLKGVSIPQTLLILASMRLDFLSFFSVKVLVSGRRWITETLFPASRYTAKHKEIIAFKQAEVTNEKLHC